MPFARSLLKDMKVEFDRLETATNWYVSMDVTKKAVSKWDDLHPSSFTTAGCDNFLKDKPTFSGDSPPKSKSKLPVTSGSESTRAFTLQVQSDEENPTAPEGQISGKFNVHLGVASEKKLLATSVSASANPATSEGEESTAKLKGVTPPNYEEKVEILVSVEAETDSPVTYKNETLATPGGGGTYLRLPVEEDILISSHSAYHAVPHDGRTSVDSSAAVPHGITTSADTPDPSDPRTVILDDIDGSVRKITKDVSSIYRDLSVKVGEECSTYEKVLADSLSGLYDKCDVITKNLTELLEESPQIFLKDQNHIERMVTHRNKLADSNDELNQMTRAAVCYGNLKSEARAAFFDEISAIIESIEKQWRLYTDLFITTTDDKGKVSAIPTTAVLDIWMFIFVFVVGAAWAFIFLSNFGPANSCHR